MKKWTLVIGVFFTAGVFTACSDAPKGDTAVVSDAQQAAAPTAGQTFNVDTTASYIRFVGHGVGKNHPGRFKISDGTLTLANNTVQAGKFTINMHSMEVEEKGDMFQNKLKPHLQSADFFDVEKWNTAHFEITDVKPYTATGTDTSVVAGANHMVSGNLTLKGQTKNVSFPAKVDVSGKAISARANFDINRRDWGMAYGNDKSLGDKFISETVNIELDLKASQQ